MPSSGASWQLKKKYQCQNLNCHLYIHIGSPLSLLMILYLSGAEKMFHGPLGFHDFSWLFQVPQSQWKMKCQKQYDLLGNNNSVLQTEQSVPWKSLYSTYYRNTAMTDAIRTRTENSFGISFLIGQKHQYIKKFMTAGTNSSHDIKQRLANMWSYPFSP